MDACNGCDICKDDRRILLYPQKYDLGATRGQTTRTSKEDVKTADGRGHEGRRGQCGYALMKNSI